MNPNNLLKGKIYYHITYEPFRGFSDVTDRNIIYNPVIFIKRDIEMFSGRERFCFLGLRAHNNTFVYFTLGGANSVIWDVVENEGEETTNIVSDTML